MFNFQKNKLFNVRWIFVLLAFSGLFLGFYRNQWQVVHPKKFSLFQKDVESYVIARMVQTRQNGILSHGGLLGWGDVDPSDINEDDYQHQFEVYLKGYSFQSYWAKQTHPGFQGIFFSALDSISPFSPSNNLRAFRILTAGLFAAVMTGILIWFHRELGWLSAAFVFASILSSQWMTLFGRNLFFMSGLFYLPMLLLLFRLRTESMGTSLSQRGLFRITFASLLLKCLFNGFDFILPTLGMMASPLVFYGVKDKWSKHRCMERSLDVIMAVFAAVLTTLLILSIQIMLETGSLEQAVHAITHAFSRRTLGSDQNLLSAHAEVQNASTWSILKIYLSESYFYSFHVPYYSVIILVGFASAMQIVTGKIRMPVLGDVQIKGNALSVATWFSILGPLGWYIIFKSVAYFHTHMNYLPWHMPFTLFGFGLCGFLIQSFFSSIKEET